MAEAAWLGPNASCGGAALNLSAPHWAAVAPPVRAPAAAAILLLVLLGNGLLLHRLRCGPCGGRRQKKANFLLAHLAAADLCCGGLLLGPQLQPSEPATSDAACRLLRVLQASAVLAPSNMAVLIALERRGPGARRVPRAASACLAWLLALLLALPQASAFRQWGGRCLVAFPRRPAQLYAAYWGLVGFVAPAGLLGAACGRILWSLRASPEEAAAEEGNGGAAPPAGPPPRLLRCLPGPQCASPAASPSRSLPRARTRGLQLALALGALLALCGLPRFALELAAAAEGPPSALGSLLAAANAALNPLACLLFRSHGPRARRLQRSLCRCLQGPPPRRRARARPHAPPPPPEGPPGCLCPCQQRPPPPEGNAWQAGAHFGPRGVLDSNSHNS